MKRNNKKGFTIVELVIVIAVIGILAGVLIPTFSSLVSTANANAALQEARNEYTQYLITDADADIDYVLYEGKYYDVKDGFALEGTNPTTGSYLDASDDTVKTLGSN